MKPTPREPIDNRRRTSGRLPEAQERVERAEAEARWRRDVMGEAKDALACGDGKAAYEALTRHEQGGYPWAPGATSNMGPDVARKSYHERAADEASAAWQTADAEVERLRERGDAVVHAAREVMHGRMHSGELLLAIRAWEGMEDR